MQSIGDGAQGGDQNAPANMNEEEYQRRLMLQYMEDWLGEPAAVPGRGYQLHHWKTLRYGACTENATRSAYDSPDGDDREREDSEPIEDDSPTSNETETESI